VSAISPRRGELRPIRDLPASVSPALVEVEDADGTARQAPFGGGGGNPFGPLPVRNVWDFIIGATGNLNARTPSNGDGYWTAWEYTGAANNYVVGSFNSILRTVGDGVVLARSNVDVCSQRMVATLRTYRTGDSPSAWTHAICIGVPSTPIGSYTNVDFVRMAISRNGPTTAEMRLQFRPVTGTAFIDIAAPAFTTVPSPQTSTYWYYLTLDGGLLQAWSHSSDDLSAATLHLSAALPTYFFGSDGVVFPRGRRGGVMTGSTTTGAAYITGARFNTF
jgi:hypothetical protein